MPGVQKMGGADMLSMESVHLPAMRQRARLVSFLNQIKSYREFDPGQTVRIYLHSGFIVAVESVEYDWSFIVFGQKLCSVDADPLIVSFQDLYTFLVSA